MEYGVQHNVQYYAAVRRTKPCNLQQHDGRRRYHAEWSQEEGIDAEWSHSCVGLKDTQ